VKVTFPHMGNQYVATKVLLEELGLDVVIPPQCSQDTLDIGTKHSPESICFCVHPNNDNKDGLWIQFGYGLGIFCGSHAYNRRI